MSRGAVLSRGFRRVPLALVFGLLLSACHEARGPRRQVEALPETTSAGEAPAAEANSTGHSGATEPSAAALACTLSVVVRGLRNNDGRVAVALFNQVSGFPEQSAALASKVAKPKKNTATLRFAAVPCGRYALALHHDENTNQEMDYNLLGIPREGFGFSRDAKVSLGPPSFEAAAFELQAATQTETVGVQYF